MTQAAMLSTPLFALKKGGELGSRLIIACEDLCVQRMICVLVDYR